MHLLTPGKGISKWAAGWLFLEKKKNESVSDQRVMNVKSALAIQITARVRVNRNILPRKKKKKKFNSKFQNRNE